jgi:Bacterial Ig-like domain
VVAPTLLISPLTSNPTSAAFPAIFTFSKPVTGFTATDILVTNGTAASFVMLTSSVYKAIITPTAAGTVTVQVAAGMALDLSGNGNLFATMSIVFQ